MPLIRNVGYYREGVTVFDITDRYKKADNDRSSLPVIPLLSSHIIIQKTSAPELGIGYFTPRLKEGGGRNMK